MEQRTPAGGTRIIASPELATMPDNIAGKTPIEIRPMPKAGPTERKVLNAAMAKEYAVPVLDSVTRNLDYLDATVKKFLSLGRVERGELAINKTALNLKKDVFDSSIHSLAAMTAKKSLKISNEVSPELIVQADADLMQIVANNLVSNAIKYSPEGGRIEITARPVDGKVEIDVYNDATPIIIMTGIRREMNLPFGFEPDETWLPVKRVLEKPVKPEVLLSAISENIRKT